MTPALHPSTTSHRSIAGDPAIALAALIAISIVLGGGGVDEAFSNLSVQLAALLLCALHGLAPLRDLAIRGPRVIAALILATCLLPLVQLIPLPPALWQALPGRELVGEAFDAASQAGWNPLTVDRGRTLLAFVGLLAPMAVLVIGLAQPPARLVMIQRTVIALGLVSAAFGSLHFLDPQWGDLYAGQRPLPGVMVGTFADRNAAALFFVCCLLLLVGLPDRTADRVSLAWKLVLAALLTIAVVLTRSRSGIALLLLPAALFVWRVVAGRLSPVSGEATRPRKAAIAAAAAVLALVASVGLLLTSGQTRTSIERFDHGDGMRAEMRIDALYAAKRYWPVGAGMGTFDEVFQVDEALEHVTPRKAGRAHMDYYELAIEAGIAGLALLAAWLVWYAVAAWRAVRQPDAWPARAAVFALAAVAAQSFVGYPLRNQAMLCLAAFAIVLLARSPALSPRQRAQK